LKLKLGWLAQEIANPPKQLDDETRELYKREK
jgi:hypothetical protein